MDYNVLKHVVLLVSEGFIVEEVLFSDAQPDFVLDRSLVENAWAQIKLLLLFREYRTHLELYER